MFVVCHGINMPRQMAYDAYKTQAMARIMAYLWMMCGYEVYIIEL